MVPLKSDTPAPSVIVPAYNAAATLAACVESLLRQIPAPGEVIVVDDASVDETGAIASRLGVTVIRLERNSGPGVARNAGAAAARGEVLAFTDADCVAPPRWLEKILAALEEPGVVAVTGGYGGPVRETFLTRLQHLVIRERQAALPRYIESTITSNFACRKADFAAVGGFPLYYRRGAPGKPVWGNEDEELGYLLARGRGRIRWLPDAGVLHLFRLDLAGYLRQQHFYAKSIVTSQFRFPEMARTRTNYSRSSGVIHLGATAGLAAGLFAALGALAGVPAAGWAAAALLAVCAPLFLLLPLPTLAALRRRGEGAGFLAAAYPVMLTVDVAWLSGAVVGVLSSARGFIDGNDKSAAAPAAPRQ